MTQHSSLDVTEVAAQLTQLTLDECAAAIGVTTLPPQLRRLAVAPFLPFARRLGAQVAQFDAEASVSLAQAAAALLTRLHVPMRPTFTAPVPTLGPLLVISNHPGAYDAMLLFATLPRPDLRLIAAERGFLRSLPNLSRHLVYVPDPPATDKERGDDATEATDKKRRDDATEAKAVRGAASATLGARGRGLREVVRHLKGGGAVLHFAAGQIEPDPAFSTPQQCISAWSPATAALANTCVRLGGQVVLALVSGVHSPRVKHSALIRFAEAHGVTTLSGLLQIALPRVFPVSPLVHYAAPISADSANTVSTEQLQHALRRLASPG